MSRFTLPGSSKSVAGFKFDPLDPLGFRKQQQLEQQPQQPITSRKKVVKKVVKKLEKPSVQLNKDNFLNANINVQLFTKLHCPWLIPYNKNIINANTTNTTELNLVEQEKQEQLYYRTDFPLTLADLGLTLPYVDVITPKDIGSLAMIDYLKNIRDSLDLPKRSVDYLDPYEVYDSPFLYKEWKKKANLPENDYILKTENEILKLLKDRDEAIKRYEEYLNAKKIVQYLKKVEIPKKYRINAMSIMIINFILDVILQEKVAVFHNTELMYEKVRMITEETRLTEPSEVIKFLSVTGAEKMRENQIIYPHYDNFETHSLDGPNLSVEVIGVFTLVYDSDPGQIFHFEKYLESAKEW